MVVENLDTKEIVTFDAKNLSEYHRFDLGDIVTVEARTGLLTGKALKHSLVNFENSN